jgi:Flagellar assembly protein FliH
VKTHAFPSLHDHLTRKETPEDPPVRFQPMFKSETSVYSRGVPSQPGEQNNIDAACVEHVRQKGFQNGVDKGKIEGLRKARALLEPDLIDFLQAFENVNAFHQHVTETASHQIIRLALQICEKILGSSINLETTDMDTLRHELQKVVAVSHHLTLRMHADDTRELRELTAGFNLEWPSQGVVSFEAGSLLSRGSLQPVADDPQREGLKQFIEKRLREPLTP